MKTLAIQISKLVETVEFAVPLANEETLIFKLEVWAHGVRPSRHYRCRLYRLESFKFQVIHSLQQANKKIEGADYRCWVMDDNLGVDVPTYQSASVARKTALAELQAQLGI
jgi:hypothetical protein